MVRPTYVEVDASALMHNLNYVKRCAPKSKVIAMVKANAYGCGLSSVVPFLDGQVDALGVASLEEAKLIRRMGVSTDCILCQGLFSQEELVSVVENKFQCVIHQQTQLSWLLAQPLANKIKVWVKVNTGMHRLGFAIEEVRAVLIRLHHCNWVDAEIGLMTHLACSDVPSNSQNQNQLQLFRELDLPSIPLQRSICNSGAILAFPDSHADAVRPGIMLYGVSPFPNRTAQELGLRPVMRFLSSITAIHSCPAGAQVGYGGTWLAKKVTRVGVVAVGYGDGYPRHIAPNTLVQIRNHCVPIIGRVSMDMLTIDLTQLPESEVGDVVELWGPRIPIEHVAASAGTIGYELLCQFSSRVRQETRDKTMTFNLTNQL